MIKFSNFNLKKENFPDNINVTLRISLFKAEKG